MGPHNADLTQVDSKCTTDGGSGTCGHTSNEGPQVLLRYRPVRGLGVWSRPQQRLRRPRDAAAAFDAPAAAVAAVPAPAVAGGAAAAPAAATSSRLSTLREPL